MNMPVTIHLIKSFTKDKSAGNPTGIALNVDYLSDAQILKITKKLGFAESAFLQKSDTADYKIRLFSVKGEVNSCVTATIAAAFIILKKSNKNEVSFETKLGVRTVLRKKDGLLLMKQPKVEFIHAHPIKEKVAALLHISPAKIMNSPIEVWSVGTPKLLIPIHSRKTLFEIKPDLNGIAAYCQKIGARGFYPFTFDTINPEAHFHARQFNPLDGIAEDPVTGVAAAALTAYLRKYTIVMDDKLIGEQGYIINKPGEIIIEIINDEIYVGGYAVEFGEKAFNII